MNPNNLESILLVTSKNPENHNFGTGFVIFHSTNSSWVVTCAHVVNDVGGEISLEINGNPAKIIGTGTSDGLDLSLLETEKRLDMPIIELSTYGLLGSPFTTAGFQLFGKHYSKKVIMGRIIQKNELVTKFLQERIKVWTITILVGDTLQDGYSGAPLIDEQSGFCVGVISYKLGDGENGLAISIDELKKILPAESLNLFKKPNWSQTYNTFADHLFSSAIRLQINGELQDSLELFKQVKKANPEHPRIDMMISSVERELGQRYVKHGRIHLDRDMDSDEFYDFDTRQKHNYRSPLEMNSKISLFSPIGCVLFVLVTSVVIGYFLLSR